MATTISAFSTSFRSFSDNSTGENYIYDFDYEDQYGICVSDQHGARFLPALYSIFFLLGFFGNSLVIWVIVYGVRLRSMTDVCLLNLAVADLLLVSCLPFLAHQAWDQWIFGDFMCKMVMGIYHVVFYSGIFFISLMSIDRYLAIVHVVYALKARTRSFGMIAAAITWLAALMSSLPDPIFLQQSTINDYTYCFSDYENDGSTHRHLWRIFSLLKMNVLGLFIPTLIMGFCYSQIIWKLLFTHSSKKVAIRLVLTVVAVFWCCWFPYNVASFFKTLEFLQIYTGCETNRAITLTLQVTEAMAYFHSCLNPVLYVFVGEKFRKHLVRLINRTPCTLCRTIAAFLPHDRATSSMYSQTSSLNENSNAV